MADMSQAEKRATGLKMLKQYQQHKTSSTKPPRKKQGTSNSSEKMDNNEHGYNFFTGFADSAENKVASSGDITSEVQCVTINGESTGLQCEQKNQDITSIDNHINSEELVDEPLNNNHVSQSNIAQPFPTPASIFASNSLNNTSNYSDFFDTIQTSVDQCPEQNVILPVIEDKFINAPPSNEKLTTDSVSSFKDSVPSHVQSENSSLNTDANENIKKLDSELNTLTNESNVHNRVNTINKEGQLKENISQISSMSSTESLRQLSLEMNVLMDDTSNNIKQHVSETEQRNQELATLLGKEQQRAEQLQLELKEYQLRVSQLQVDLERQQTELQARQQRELGSLQEQLQFHIQTVGILVGEKTELVAALSKSQQTAKQKAVEVEDLQGHNKSLQHRVNDLEKELSMVANLSKQFENSSQDQTKELNRVKLEKQMVVKQLEEVEEEAAELRQNFNVKSNEVIKLQQLIQEKQSQLDLAQLRVQQLSSSDSPDMEQQLESMHQKKVGLENQVAELQQTVRALGGERDQMNSQYQEYLQNVNNQLKNMADKLAATVAENEKLTNREQSLVKHLSDLEKQLQHQQEKLQLQQQQGSQESPTQSVDTEHVVQMEQRISHLQIENKKLEANLEEKVQENTSLQDEVKTYASRLEELEVLVETLKADQPDTSKLLAAMESDKVAAARAVGQNQKLKEQLGELEEGFIQMSNSKLDLTEQLLKEQHLSKELSERLTQQELEISELRNQLQKNEALLQQNQSQQSWQLLQHNQIADQMRHYEAQGQMTEVLQNELHVAQKCCETLRSQNNELRMQLAQMLTPRETDLKEGGKDTNELVDSLSASIRQLEMERDELLGQLQKKDLSQFVESVHTGTDVPDSLMLSNGVDVEEYVNMKEAMSKLEERFTKTMSEVAELSDEKQRLEHLVLQLQGETETIGEYIALYQMQRSILRQRAQEKDEQLARLARDREEVKTKLNELNRLIGQLVSEKEMQQNVSVHTVPTQVEEQSNMQVGVDVLANGDINSIEVKRDGSIDNKVQASKITKNETAGKIIALLSEIETSTLVEPCNSENFHPCPWCSGRLITV